MATTKPRITITLEPEQHDVLQRLAALQRAPMSRIVSDLINEVTPMLEKLLVTLEAASRAHHDVKANIRRTAEEAEAELQPLAAAALAQLDMFSQMIAGMVPQADAGGGADPATAAADDAGPRPVITGATTSQRKGTGSRGESRRVVSESASPGAK
jgi:hypothetical protein